MTYIARDEVDPVLHDYTENLDPVMTRTIHDARIQTLNDADPGQASPGKYVLYWMQHSQRARHNDALEYAVQRANHHGVPMVVGFGLTEDYPDGNERHFRFMLEGLRETADSIRRRSIGFVLRLGAPVKVAIDLAGDAVEVVTDRGYLRHHRRWRNEVAQHITVRMTQVECDLIVPVETASDDREYAARTIRKQINDAAEAFLADLDTTAVDHRIDEGDGDVDIHRSGENTDDIDGLIKRMNIDRSVGPVDWVTGGTRNAVKRLDAFCQNDLTGYDDHRSDVPANRVSVMSPYLHLGMISPVQVYRTIRDARSRRTEDIDSYLEELLVRRELAHNFVYYAADTYDDLSALPEWSAKTLMEHRDDPREHIYTAEELENAQTHDAVWNAAMTQMKHRGYLHNHLRMYWGKQFLRWTNTPRYAHKVLLELNNKYFLDGRDANSYANVLWVFGLHDRAWGEREVYGKVRTMTGGGLKDKFDTAAYVRAVAAQTGETIANAEDK